MRENIHQYFMNIAKVVASRSTCIKRHVGTIIVKNKKIISCGYNNPSVGLPNCTTDTCILDGLQKCTKATHSEINALLQATPQDRENATLYCTCYPCSKCQLAILNSGVTTVIYDEKHHSEIDFFKGTHVQCYSLEEIIKLEEGK